MHLRGPLLASALIAFAVSIEASPRAEFNTAYRAFNAAIEEARYVDAVGHARDALRLARNVMDAGSPEMAILTFNHGYALARAGYKRNAYRALIDAQVLATKVFGANAEELIQVEIELAHTGLPQLAINHLERALELAERHHGEDSEFVADLKVEGGTRIWKEGAAELLAGAADAYRRLGKTDKYALAQYWLRQAPLRRWPPSRGDRAHDRGGRCPARGRETGAHGASDPGRGPGTCGPAGQGNGSTV